MQTRYNTTLAATLAVSLVMFSACAENGSSNQPAGTGGSSGGSTSSTGGASSGGATAKGGTTAGTGGNSSGGNTSAGGAGSGGATSSGGKTGAGAGGSASGGTTGGGGSAAGGTTGGGGSSAAGGSVAAGKLCKFSSGLNVAWVQFAGDVPNPNIATFQTIFTNTYASGGRIVRWWFHTNGTVTPGYQADGTAQKIPQSHIDGVKAILAAANAAKIGVVISLWSFDMLQADATCTGNPSTTTTVCKNNHALLEQDTNRQAYIDNYLTPLVTALKGTPGLYAYEIFNEAEGMMESGANGAQPWGWATERTTTVAVQKCVNWFASAIHAADPTVPVTTAAQTFDYCSNGVSGKTNYYSDSVLQSVGGKATGTLDFYEVHYYASNGASDSCFANPASYWKLDKRLIMGEFAVGSGSGQTVVGTSPVDNTSPVAVDDAYTYLYTSAYDGAWAWSYTEGNPAYQWPSMQTPMKNLLAAHADVGTCP